MNNTPKPTQLQEDLLKVIRGLAVQTDLAAVLKAIAQAAVDLTGSQECSLLVCDRSKSNLRCLTALQNDPEQQVGSEVPLEGSAAGWVFTHSQPLIVAHTEDEQRFSRGVDRRFELETGSILAVPLIYQGATIGVMQVASQSDDIHYTEEDVNTLEALASQAAMTVQSERLEDQNQTAFGQLANLEQMKSDFIAISSQELRTPVGLILGHATFLRENASADQIPQIDIILRSAMRLKEIIDEFSYIQEYKKKFVSYQYRAFSLDELIQAAADSSRELAVQRGVTLRADVSNAGVKVEADFEKMKDALGSLVQNSLDYRGENSRVLISSGQLPGFVKVMVSHQWDNPTAEEPSKIFEPSAYEESQLSRRYKEIDLKLARAREIIEAHGGRVWTESIEGKGHRISFILPYTPPPPEMTARVYAG